ncbi:MAG: ribbon-helix-helix protein, CopG family [Bacteroidales bacterium]|nr:ribbon-helix-helix protein, CopG family [Bacteroidales bacterium]MDZ4204304.1 ribbon-helix-helix protein, CopG family [Bacteroidales bacterium]
MKSINYTSSLPAETLKLLDEYAKKISVPKNWIMERALRAYFDKLKQVEYVHSFRKAAGDKEMLSLAEKGLEDYLKILGEE